MALNSSGPISLAGSTTGQSIAVELGVSPTGTISLNDTNVRTLAGVASGAIVMPTNFYGKSSIVTINITISSNTQDYNIFSNKGGTYVAGKSIINVTINSGVSLGGSSSYALNTGTGWASGDTINIINNGNIAGKAGSVTNASSPGTAIYMSWPLTITNGSGYIFSGGGAGGSGGDGGSDNGGAGGDGGGWRPWTSSVSLSGANGEGGTPTGGGGGFGGGIGVTGQAGGSDSSTAGGGGGGGGGGAAGGDGGDGDLTNGSPGQASTTAIITNGYGLSFVSGSGRVYGGTV
jgi:hypothetical protein